MTPREALDFLSLPENASQNDILQRYKVLAREYHPDKNPDNTNEATIKFQQLGIAVSTLKEHFNKTRPGAPENYDIDHAVELFREMQSSLPDFARSNYQPVETLSNQIFQMVESSLMSNRYRASNTFDALMLSGDFDKAINLRNDKGETPLHLSANLCARGTPSAIVMFGSLVQYALTHSFDFSLTDNSGATIYDYLVDSTDVKKSNLIINGKPEYLLNVLRNKTVEDSLNHVIQGFENIILNSLENESSFANIKKLIADPEFTKKTSNEKLIVYQQIITDRITASQSPFRVFSSVKIVPNIKKVYNDLLTVSQDDLESMKSFNRQVTSALLTNTAANSSTKRINNSSSQPLSQPTATSDMVQRAILPTSTHGESNIVSTEKLTDSEGFDKRSINKHPIVLLDVDETLILGHDKDGNAINIYNDELIDALVEAGVTEVYLLTAYKLHLQPDIAQRKELNEILRLDLIRYLTSKKINVIAVVSNNDLVHNHESQTDELITDSSIANKQPFIPGSYYSEVIKPYEMLLRNTDGSDTGINLLTSGKLNYAEDLKKQQVYDTRLHELPHDSKRYSEKNIKSLLADLLFTSLKKKQILNVDNPRQILFIDDKTRYIQAVQEAAKHHELPISCLHVTHNSTKDDYLGFFNQHYSAIFSYHTIMRAMKPDLEQLRNTMAKSLSGIIIHSPHKSELLHLIDKISKVSNTIIKDLEKNNQTHDSIGACNALLQEISSRIRDMSQLIADKGLDNTSKEGKAVTQAVSILREKIDTLSRIRTDLQNFYSVDFNTGRIESERIKAELGKLKNSTSNEHGTQLELK